MPAGATAVVANVTATGATAQSFLTAYPDGTTRPLASNLNFGAGQTVPNLVTVPLSAGGAIDLYNAVGIGQRPGRRRRLLRTRLGTGLHLAHPGPDL